MHERFSISFHFFLQTFELRAGIKPPKLQKDWQETNSKEQDQPLLL